MQLSLQVRGINECLRRLREIDRRLEKKALRKSVRQGGQIVQGLGRSNASYETGALKRSMHVKSKTYRGKVILAITGPKDHKYASGRNPARYGHLIEHGFRIVRGGRLTRYRRRKWGRELILGYGYVVGYVHGKHYMLRAARSAESRVIETIFRSVRNELAYNLPVSADL